MRILFLIRSLELGGAERQVVALSNTLAQRGHAVGVAVFYAGGALEKELEGVELFALEKKGRWDIAGFLRRLGRCVNTFRPDVLHGDLGSGNLFALSRKLFTPRLPVFWGYRASDMDLSAYGLAAVLHYKVECFFSRWADAIISNSKAGLEHAVAHGFPSHKCHLVPNGVDIHRFRPDREAGLPLRAEWDVDASMQLVGLVARIDRAKDHATFLQAAARVASARPDVRFVCVGGGPDDGLRQELLSETARLGLSEVVVWAGARTDMVAVYNALDVCCLSSVTEGLPNVLCEAMSCSVPCVVTDAGDMALVVGDPRQVVPRRTPEALGDALLALLGRKESGEVDDPRRRIIEAYSLESMAGTLESLCLNAIGKDT